VRWIDRMLLAGVAVALFGGAALYAGAQRSAGALDLPNAQSSTDVGDLDQRIARIVERCVIEGAGTHLAFIRCVRKN